MWSSLSVKPKPLSTLLRFLQKCLLPVEEVLPWAGPVTLPLLSLMEPLLSQLDSLVGTCHPDQRLQYSIILIFSYLPKMIDSNIKDKSILG